MFPLKTNMENLQKVFGGFYKAVSNGEIPGQSILSGCLAECNATNEISGMQFLHAKGYRTNFIKPIFIAGTTNDAELLCQVVGEQAANFISSAEKKNDPVEFVVRKHWHNDHLILLEKASQLKDPVRILEHALIVALSVLKDSPHRVAMVCGPISTGNGKVSDNMYRFNRTIMEVGKFMDVFNQLPFEGLFKKAHDLIDTTHAHVIDVSPDAPEEERRKKRSAFFMELFYERIIKGAGKHWEPYFMDGWRNSTGATIEHDLFEMLGFKPKYLLPDYGLLN